MTGLKSSFTIDNGGQTLHIQPHKAGGITVFAVRFPDDRQPLVITLTRGEMLPASWTSIPEGRQTEAEEIGPLITAHYQYETELIRS